LPLLPRSGTTEPSGARLTLLRRLASSLVAVVALVACVVETDRSVYEAGEIGWASVENVLPIDAYVGSCPPYFYEHRVGDEWITVEPPFACPGSFARPVAPRERGATD
jgi:hypothetical protein